MTKEVDDYEREFDYSELEYCEECGRPPKECSGCGEED